MAKKAKTEVGKDSSSLRFDHEGKTYEFVVPQFRIIGTGTDVVKATEALADPNLLAELVKIQSGVIKLIS